MGGSPIPHGGHVTANIPIEADISCAGVVLSASLMVGSGTQVKTYSVGPVTKANSYDSVVAHMFPEPIKIDAVGMVEFNGTFKLVDGTVREIAAKKIAIDAPPAGFVDISQCLHKCDMKPLKPNYVQFLPFPQVSGSLNKYEDDAERIKLAEWVANVSKGEMATNVVTLLSLAYPNFPNVMVCQRLDWLPVGFDPKNSCEETPIGGRGYMGCLDPESEVTVRPGQTVPIKSLRVGHYVLNPITQKSMRISRVIKGPEKKPMNKLLTTTGAELIMTGNHPVFTTAGTKLAADVKVSDQILWSNKWVTVHNNISFMPAEGQEVWNITLDGGEKGDEHWIEANDMVVGDLWMQERMAREVNGS